MLLPLILACSALAAEPLPLTPDCTLRLATADEGRRLLAARDRWAEALSPFDRSARLKTDRNVTLEELLEFAGQQARDWTPEEAGRHGTAWAAIARKLSPFRLPLPKSVLVIKTTGLEEGRAAYTRGPAIILPEPRLRLEGAALERLLLHELFHVLSRHDPALRRQLYAIVGFEPSGPLPLPPDLAARKITNPDAWELDYAVALRVGEERLRAVPLLISTIATYDPAQGGEFFRYVQFRLLAIEGGVDAPRAQLVDGRPRLLDPDQTPDYLNRLGRNTKYIIHAEEALADNFVLLVTGAKDVTTPRILTEMGKLLARPLE